MTLPYVLIIGAGGLGRVVMAQALRDHGCGREWNVAGFLDTRPPDSFPNEVASSILGDPMTFQPRPYELFLPAVGNTRLRQTFVESLVSRGAQIIGLRPDMIFGPRCVIGNANFGPHVSVGPDCTIGDFGFFDESANIGHDVHIGEYVHVGINVVVAGNVRIGNRVVLHSGSMVARGVTIGDDAEVGMGAVVLRDVPAGALVMGNPARMVKSNPEATQ
jgi:sugar O-acyltransferase (sialic acid O-acetyltransferase NeuD family)